MISNSQSYEDQIENLCVQFETKQAELGKILLEIQELFRAQGKPGEGWRLHVEKRLGIKENTAHRLIQKYEIMTDLAPHVGPSREPTVREVETILPFKREEPELYEEVLKTKPTLEQLLEVARAEQSAFEADTAAHEAQRIKVEATRMDPNESIGYKILSASLDLSLPVNEDKVTGKTLAEYLETHISSPMDTIALSMLRQKLNSAFNIMGID